MFETQNIDISLLAMTEKYLLKKYIYIYIDYQSNI